MAVTSSDPAAAAAFIHVRSDWIPEGGVSEAYAQPSATPPESSSGGSQGAMAECESRACREMLYTRYSQDLQQIFTHTYTIPSQVLQQTLTDFPQGTIYDPGRNSHNLTVWQG